MLELKTRASELENTTVNSVYFGGGTPSILEQTELSEILDTIQKNYGLSSDAEITFECNPDDLTKDKLKFLKSQGINRLSIGVQSFDQEVLMMMNRAHTADEALSCILLAQDIGFEDMTIDLIYGVPGKSPNYWEDQISQFLELRVPHLSAYCLTIEPNTVFGYQYKNEQLNLPGEEEIRVQFDYLIKRLKSASYEHYEISNFASNGKIARHNSAYWLDENYVGIGPSAHSYDGETRRWNLANNSKYMKALEDQEIYFDSEQLSLKDKFNDHLLTRLRTKWGIDLTVLKKLDTETHWSAFEKSLKQQIELGNLYQEGNQVYMTNDAKFIVDYVTAQLFI